MDEQPFKLDDEGICNKCLDLALDSEWIECTSCNCRFHAVCNVQDGKRITKTNFSLYKASSTKRNFKLYFCDACLTKFEMNKANTESVRVKKLEECIKVIMTELKEIKGAFHSRQQADTVIDTKETQISGANSSSSPEPTLFIDQAADEEINRLNMGEIENIVVQNQPMIKKSFRNKNKKLVVVCDSMEARDKLKHQIENKTDDIEIKTPKEKKSVVSIVGIERALDKEEVSEMPIKQNAFLQKFSSEEIADHINVFSGKKHT